MKHLTKAQIANLKEMLMVERDTLASDVKEVFGKSTPDHGDSADLAADISDAAISFGLEDHEHNELVEIEAALERMKNGTYGLCEMSGEPIPFLRLKAIPTARYTAKCQEKIDMGRSKQKR